ncbi:MAG: translocation/assembly module TamB [Xanthomonadaceae bacterium]|nr:translocation/assembly module TamB [Xanthomonadaceae bacterium]
MKIGRRKKILYLFIFIVFASAFGFMQFIQSETFVKLAMKVATRYIPKNSGIQADFSNLEIHLFPPGISINDAKVSFEQENIAHVPGGSKFQSKVMGIYFHPLQLFSRDLRAQVFEIEEGMVSVELKTAEKEEHNQKKDQKINVVWDQLLKLRFEGLSLKKTIVELNLPDEKIKVRWNAEKFILRQEIISGSLGYGMDLAISEFLLNDLKKNQKIEVTQLKVSGIASPKLVRLSQVELIADGVSVTASGQLDGDVLSSGNLPSKGEVKLKVDLAKLMAFANPKDQKNKLSGTAEFNGKVSGDLKDSKHTLQASGQLDMKSPVFNGWRADSLKVGAEWEPTQESWVGQLSLHDLKISGSPLPRIPGTAYGYGGVVSIKEAIIRAKPLRIDPLEIELEQVHPHWLLGDAAAGIFALDFRATGKIKVALDNLEKKKDLLVQTDLDLIIDSFVLDNQKRDMKKPLTRVFSVPKIRLQGKSKIDSNAFTPEDMNLLIGESKLIVGGNIGFDSGYNLKAKGDVFNLGSIGSISETKIIGTGKIDVHVHGPGDDVRIDIDADLKDASYLDLNLGSLKGKISFLDARNQIEFTKVQLMQGTTQYMGNGVLDVGKIEKANLDFTITKGEFQDLTFIFDHFVKKISWYPTDLTGSISGDVQVRGGLSMSELIIKSDLKFKDAEYKGERVHHGRLVGGYTRGDYAIDRASLVKQRKEIIGSISYNDKDGVDWTISTQDLDLNEIDWIGSLDLPIRGAINWSSTGSGKFGAIKSISTGSIHGLSVRGEPYPDSSIKISSQKGNWKINGDALKEMGKLDLDYDFNPAIKSKISLRAQKLDFAPLFMILNPKLVNDLNLKAIISGSLDVDFRSGQFELGDGQFTIQEYLLKRQGHQLLLSEPVRTELMGGNFDFKTYKLTGLEGDLLLKLKSTSGKLDGWLSGEADLGLIEYLTNTVSNCTGVADLSLKIGGTIKEPNILGNIDISQGEVRITSLESPLENIQSQISVENGVFSLERFTAGLARGDVSANGQVELFVDRIPEVDLSIRLRDSQIKIYPFQSIKLSGALKVAGDELPFLISGDLTSDSGLSKEEFGGGSGLSGGKITTYMPGVNGSEAEESLFNLKVNMRSERGIWVKNSLMEAEWGGKFTVINSMAAPRAVGEANLIQGKLFFKDRQFNMLSGKVSFDNPTQINPRFNILSSAEINRTKINLAANGRLNEWSLDLTSNPSLPTSEILSLLSIGFTSEELSRQTNVNRSSLSQTEAATVVLNSLNFNKDLQNKTGFEVQLNEAQTSQIGNSVTKPQGTADLFASPKIVIRRRIGDRLSLSVGSTVGVGTNIQREANAEYRLNDSLSFQGVFNAFEQQQSASSVSTQQTSYGADIKVQRRFK